MASAEKPLDWEAWHKPYDDPDSRLARRLRTVQGHLRRALEERSGAVKLISMCAGQGRDVIPVLAAHDRSDDVSAVLVELDPRNAATAEVSAREAGLSRVRVVVGDASTTDAYVDAAPADIVLACGIFGNITDADIEKTVRHLPMLCAREATVLWTRGRWKDNDPTPEIRRWFGEAGFEEIAFDSPEEDEFPYSVGVERFVGEPRTLELGITLFQFFR
jgi:hypothetical protein